MIFIILSSFEFLNSNLSAFTLSKGSAISGIKNESSQLFMNPSGFGNDFFLSYYRYISGIDIISSSKGFYFFGNNIGLGFILVNGGKMVQRDTLGDSLGVFYDVSFIPYLGIKKDLNNIVLGLSIFFPYEKILEYSSYGSGLNIGMIYSINEKLHTGLSIRNLGYIFKPFIDYRYNLKSEFRLGISYEDQRKYIGFDIMFPFSFGLGFNLNLTQNIIFNLGYNKNANFNTGEENDIFNGFIFGFGIKKGNTYFTYNVLFAGIFGFNHSFGIRF